jgi:hypothetical protein
MLDKLQTLHISGSQKKYDLTGLNEFKERFKLHIYRTKWKWHVHSVIDSYRIRVTNRGGEDDMLRTLYCDVHRIRNRSLF